jgi:uncharacterized protein (TIGR00730 family)
MKIGITLTSSLDVDQKYIDLTGKVASAIASKGHGIVYGGTAYGMMNKLAESYKAADGKSLCGIIAKDLIAVTKNYEKYSGLDEEFVVDTMEDRKRKIISLSDAYIILPGGWGTFEEIGSILGGQANKLYSKPIAFYNFEGYYDTLFRFLEEMYSQKFSRVNPQEIFFSSDNLEEIFSFFEKYTAKELKDKFI